MNYTKIFFVILNLCLSPILSGEKEQDQLAKSKGCKASCLNILSCFKKKQKPVIMIPEAREARKEPPVSVEKSFLWKLVSTTQLGKCIEFLTPQDCGALVFSLRSQDNDQHNIDSILQIAKWFFLNSKKWDDFVIALPAKQVNILYTNLRATLPAYSSWDHQELLIYPLSSLNVFSTTQLRDRIARLQCAVREKIKVFLEHPPRTPNSWNSLQDRAYRCAINAVKYYSSLIEDLQYCCYFAELNFAITSLKSYTKN